MDTQQPNTQQQYQKPESEISNLTRWTVVHAGVNVIDQTEETIETICQEQKTTPPKPKKVAEELTYAVEKAILEESNIDSIQQENTQPLLEGNLYQNENDHDLSCGLCQCLGDIANNCHSFLTSIFN